MKEHILIEKAKKYTIPEPNLTQNGYTYKDREGFWIDNSSNTVMMKSAKYQKPTSKKCDIETGENQKGE